jgi:hypothetical protein
VSGLKGVPSSLTLGGVDLNRFIPNDISFEMAPGFEPVVSVNAITVSSQPLSTSATRPNWTQESVSLLGGSQAELFTIDSSTPFLWLPDKVCDAFAMALNLTYNDTLQLYVYGNGTGPSVLTDWNMTFTFTLADLPGSSKTLDITLPYDAFNQQLSFPFPAMNATFSTPPMDYFPLRRASNNTQFTIGRVLLQEVYLAVDYERNNFSISQAKFANNAVTNVKLSAITRPTNSIFAGPATDSTSGLSTAAKAGIGVGIAVVVIAIIGMVAVGCIRKRRHNAAESPTKRKGFFKRKPSGDVAKASVAKIAELLGNKRQPIEIPADRTNTRFELPGDAPVEMAAEVPASFYALDKGRNFAKPSELEHHDSGAEQPIPPHINHASLAPSLPPYSATQGGRQSGSNISPSSTLFNASGHGSATLSSGTSGISPNSASSNNLPRNTTYGMRPGASNTQAVSPHEPSPLLPPAPMDKPNSGSSLNLPRSQIDEHTTPSRSVSRSSRFREEGISNEPEQPPHSQPQPKPRYSWEDEG